MRVLSSRSARPIGSLVLCMVGLLLARPADAANVVWVSAITDPAGKDAGFVQLLESAGHTVTRFAPTGLLEPAEIAQLNAADLVIAGRAVGSDQFQNGTFATIPEARATAWNTSITKPMIVMSAYLTRRNRLGWQTGNTVPDSGPTRLTAADPAHPIFNGIAFDTDGLTTLNDYNVQVDRGTTTIGTPLQGGTVIASNPSIADGIAIAEWAVGSIVQDEIGNSMVLGGQRYFFAGGSREPSGGVTGAGALDLTTDGQQLFLNTVNYALVPEPSTFAVLGLGLSTLMLRRAGRRR